MITRLGYFILILLMGSPLLAQQDTAAAPDGSSAADILMNQFRTQRDQQSVSQNLNERMKMIARPPKTINDYHLGPGDTIELTVVGIPGLDKKQFALDGQGNIFVPYVGQVELLGQKTREAETRITGLFAASLLEDPQVTISIKEYRSQYYYVMGAVKQTGRYPLTQSIDILDALAAAGGLSDRADTNIKIHRVLQGQASESSSDPEAALSGNSTTVLDVNLGELMETGQMANRMPIYSGDVIEVKEKKDVSYYVLGDIPRPGAFLIDSNKRMSLSRALANAGGMLRTAAGGKVMIIRQKGNGDLPEQIKVDAYSVLKGDMKDIELCENDIVLVPGSASKTLAKGFLSGINGLLGTLILIGTSH
jgi:polysaccharide biosynthesis/export protein